jgi:signal transduction histidine kinase
LLAGRFRVAFLGVLLGVALGVTGFVTYRAQIASKEHRAIVERVLHDYVAWASFQLGNSTRTAMHACARFWLEPVTSGVAPVEIARLPLSECGNSGHARFEIIFADGSVRTWGEKFEPELLQWLRDTVPHHPVLPLRRTWSLGFLSKPGSDALEMIAYAIDFDANIPKRAVGFVTKSALDTILTRVVAQSHLLPPEITGGVPDSAFFATRLDGPDLAAAVYATPYHQAVRLKPEFGDFTLAVALQPASLNRIVSGGLPKNRGLELAGLFALALGLVLSSLLLLRREAQLAQTRARFVSSVSHELRTPLAQIRMFAEMLLLGRVRTASDRRRSLEIIDKEARRLTQLVENVLQVTRSENNAVRVNPSVTRIAPIVREAVETFVVLAEARRIVFRVDLQDEVMVPIDTAAVRQIMLNLLDNAAKYGPVGQHVVIGLALFNDAARLWIDDEGPGIPMRERERVFETFYRAHRDQESSITGSGIGLAVVRELAVLHGGSAWIEDAPGAGARVVVEFPGAYVAVEQPSGDWAVA